jgi:O-antigen ligase
MLRIAERDFLGKLLLAACALASVAITPKTTADPINPIKMAIISIFGFAGFSLLLPNIRKLFNSGYKWVLILTGLFVLVLGVGVATSGQNFNQEFFGVYGRNTGFVTYLSLSLLLLVATVASSTNLIAKFLYTFVTVGVVTTIYGFLQHFGIDPAGWVSPYSPIIGFLGNPDFNAAFLGMSIIAAVGLAFLQTVSPKLKIVLIPYILLTLYLMKLSIVKQGFFVVVAGLGVFAISRLYFSKFRKLASVLALIASFFAIVVLLALFNLGPLANLLYKSSLTARGYYWQAGLEMISKHPFLGVGLDNFGNWYRQTRSREAYNWSPTQYTNSAHNVFIDIAASGGLIAFLIFMLINALVVYLAFLVFKRSNGFDTLFVTLLSIWLGFNAQLFISINQIGVSVWGWVTSGLLIGFGIIRLNPETEKLVVNIELKNKKALNKVLGEKNLLPGSILKVTAGLIIGATIGLPSYIGEARYFIEMSSGDPVRIQNAAYIWPKNEQHFMQVATSLRDNRTNTSIARPELKPETIPDYSDLGIKVARDSVKFFPHSIYTYQLLRSFPGITAEEDLITKQKMRELDPFAYGK